jgi:hypothetical protein
MFVFQTKLVGMVGCGVEALCELLSLELLSAFPIKAQVCAIKGFQKLLLYASNFSDGSLFDDSVGLWVWHTA